MPGCTTNPTPNPPLVLASGSPRRRGFLRLLGLTFVVDAADVDEEGIRADTPGELVAALGQAKARVVAARHSEALVVGADTIVVLDGEVLGKPGSAARALDMLRQLRGRTHSVFSGVTAIHPERGEATEWTESVVTMRAYTDAEMRAYVDSGDPLDKAGAYAIQHEGFHPVESMAGCYASVMGFPLCHLARTLWRVGQRLEADVPSLCRAETGYPCEVYPRSWPGLHPPICG